MSAPQFEVLGDDALLVRFGERIDADVAIGTATAALRLAVQVALKTPSDIRMAAGAER